MTTTHATDYQKQGIDFLESTETTFSVKYLKSGKYFDDDKEARDIYEVELSRQGRKYIFNFGQSINDSGFYYTKGPQKILIDRKYLGTKNLLTIIRGKDREFLNNRKSDIIHYPVTPNSYDILCCLTKSEPGTFEDFCGEFGYDPDSQKAEKTYNAVREEYLQVSRLFNQEELEIMMEIQ